MKSIKLLDSEVWLTVIQDPPDARFINPNDVVAVREFSMELFNHQFSVSLALGGITQDKVIAEKIAQQLAR